MTAAERGSRSGREHIAVDPPVLYVGTPVILLATLNDDGTPNLAPASSYWALGRMLALGLETDGHTLTNLGRRPQLTVNLPSPSHWQAVERIADLTGREDVPPAKRPRYTHRADKFAAAGLTPQPSEVVAPPRVRECLLQFEAEVRRITPGVSDDYAIVEAEVVRVHADPRIVRDTDHIDPLAWEPIVYSFRHYFGIGEPLGPRGAAPADEPEGGDPACWLDAVCPECGGLDDPVLRDGVAVCPRCGARAG